MIHHYWLSLLSLSESIGYLLTIDFEMLKKQLSRHLDLGIEHKVPPLQEDFIDLLSQQIDIQDVLAVA